MESGTAGSALMAELARALELVRKLESHLDHPSPVADSCKYLAHKMLSSIQKSILMAAKSSNPDEAEQQMAADSPRSESSSPAFKDHCRKEMIKKKKTMHKWTKQVRLVPGAGGVEGPVDDGYSWRKYGQKDILGAKHPRAYYRCTHRNTQSCPATKQVQRSDEDPLLFDITYLGTHTCLQKPQRASTTSQDQQQHKLLSLKTGLKVKTEGLDAEEAQGRNFLSFELPADIFASISANDCFIGGGSSPTFLSPVTSESTYFSMSPYRISSFDGGMKLQASDSDITEIMSRANSASNSSLVDMDFNLDELDFDQDFQFNASCFFS